MDDISFIGKTGKSHIIYRQILKPKEAKCTICTVCVEVNEIFAYGPCGHGFHANCTEEWRHARESANEVPFCPMCRGVFPFVLDFGEGIPTKRPFWEAPVRDLGTRDFLAFDRSMARIFGPGYPGNPIDAMIRIHNGVARPEDEVSSYTF